MKQRQWIHNNPGHPKSPAEKAFNKAAKKARRRERLAAKVAAKVKFVLDEFEAQGRRRLCPLCHGSGEVREMITFNLPV